ncbi:TPA: hypothetical protein DEW47_01520 [Patescibacteria group bacterium]|nr:MAG: hypothetical protein UT71_C0013G0013 [Parcubacteria group bacterium GW2011_GWF2_40_10]KKR47402.1 MAG: hypothetical protein UT83_C0010G0032 [Parcubacteria group bacterium GW2011_GWA2_40_143]KKR59802.1 MAG: hypothetical protein UT97_C0010G0013 [Parcubacteria group bacterium GW2011_GWC2_40_31]KKR77208.1 MAG: hypothetical protein UU20_C0013G0023 [Parcubacteria group bacterium GW2011_GWE2_40_8]KKR82117.1 MAG: hypothetical protein UU28_C0014G0013 [Parcubacteria group bacterium GW2011_GWD2_40_
MILDDDFEGDLYEAEEKILPAILKEICRECERNIDRSEVEPQIKDKLAKGDVVTGESLCLDCLLLEALS